jgi:hypothetical protein
LFLNKRKKGFQNPLRISNCDVVIIKMKKNFDEMFTGEE